MQVIHKTKIRNLVPKFWNYSLGKNVQQCTPSLGSYVHSLSCATAGSGDKKICSAPWSFPKVFKNRHTYTNTALITELPKMYPQTALNVLHIVFHVWNHWNSSPEVLEWFGKITAVLGMTLGLFWASVFSDYSLWWKKSQTTKQINS